MRRLGRRAKTSKAKKAVEPAADEPEYTGPPSPRAIPYVEPWEGSSHPEWFEKIDAWVFAPVRHLFFPLMFQTPEALAVRGGPRCRQYRRWRKQRC